jgi:NAD(P)-dependent dehydrogenase (short-subunit alcohol dehydrogenase family)
LDVSNQQQIDAMAQLLAGQPLDMLINNAGVLGPANQRFGQTDPDAWSYVFQVNAIAPIKMMEAFADSLALGERKLAVSLSSKMASIADNDSGGYYLYRSSKAALNAAIKSAALDLAERGIAAVALHPGWVRTDMGGPDAEIEPEQSVTAMRALLESLSLNDSGGFFDLDRSIIPW